MRYYIAYGSNLNIVQMSIRCPKAKIAGTTTLDGWALAFKGSKTGSYLTIEKKKGAKTPVTIWRVTAEDEKALDRYEGFPNFYNKENMTVTMSSGRKIDAFVYIMNEGSDYGMPTKAYVRTCLSGYQFFGFDPKILEKAIKATERKMSA